MPDITGKFVQPDSTTQDAATYKNALEVSALIHQPVAGAFNVRASDTPTLSVVIDGGAIYTGVSIIEIGAQTLTGITAPVSQPRIDVIEIDPFTGSAYRVQGTPAASPARPNVTAGRVPLAYYQIGVGATAITNTMIVPVRSVIPMAIPTIASGNQIRFKDSNEFVKNIAGNDMEVASLLGGVFVSAATGPYIAYNARFDGASWNRINTSVGARLLNIQTGEFSYASVGANPITWTTIGTIGTVETTFAGMINASVRGVVAQVSDERHGINCSAGHTSYHAISASHAGAGTAIRAVSGVGGNAVSAAANAEGGTAIYAENSVATGSPVAVVCASLYGVPIRAYAPGSSNSQPCIQAISDRTASTGFSLFYGYASGGSDGKFNLRGDGTGFCDAAWSTAGADYAEYFEWADGNPDAADRVGCSVVLVGHQIRLAAPGEEPIGVISAAPGVIGDSAWNVWSGKYLRDDFGRYLMEDFITYQWTETTAHEEDDSAESSQLRTTEDAAEAPEHAMVVVQQRRRLNPAYDAGAEYLPREARHEWAPVGLMGKLRVRKGQPVGERWVKLRDISPEVEEWLIR